MINFNPTHTPKQPSISCMHRPILWIRKSDEYTVLRRIVAIIVAIFLSFTIIGLTCVIAGTVEWKRQLNDKKPFLLTDALASFNSAKVAGQVNGIYITTNETNLTATAQILKERPRLCSNTIHIGCASWHNLDIMCARRSNYGLIVDFNPKNRAFIKTTIELIKTSDSRDVFQKAMNSYLNTLEGNERKLFFHADQKGLPTDRIDKELTREGSWLSKDENYTFVKELVSKDRLIAITEDITNSETFSKIRRCLDEHHIAIDTLYLSNICDLMKTDSEKKAYVKTVQHLLKDETIFISCPKLKQVRTLETSILVQTTVLGRDIFHNPSRIFEDTIKDHNAQSNYCGRRTCWFVSSYLFSHPRC